MTNYGIHRVPRSVTPQLVATIHDVARQLGVTELTVRRHIKAGRLLAVQVGGSWRIPTDDDGRIHELPLECTVHQVANCLNVSDLTMRRWITRWRVSRNQTRARLDGAARRSRASSQDRANAIAATGVIHHPDRLQAHMRGATSRHV